MRIRTSWNQNDIKARLAASRTAAEPADLASLNAPEHERAQPSATEYENGDTSAWAEDVAKPDWKDEYSNGEVKRDEIGMPEHTASITLSMAERKASLAMGLARRTLGKKASSEALYEQSFAFMHLPTDKLIDAYNRMASEGEPVTAEDQQMQMQAQIEGLQAQAQQCMAEGKFAEAQQCIAQMMDLKAQQEGQPAQQAAPPVQAEGQPSQQQTPPATAEQTQQPAQTPVQAQQEQTQQTQEPAKEANATVTLTQAQLQNIVASAIRKAQQGQGGQGQGSQEPAPQVQAQQQPAPEAPMEASDDALLDSMLMDDAPPADMPMDLDPAWDEMGIEMDAPAMGVEEIVGDPDLESLFTAGEEAQAALALQNPVAAQQPQAPAQQGQGQGQKQASVRVASVIGTQPPGVRRIGGAPSAQPKANAKEVADLSKLWKTSPDVSAVFRLDETCFPGAFGNRRS